MAIPTGERVQQLSTGALHAGLVGQRVIVRHTVDGAAGPSGGPAMTDVLGVLEEWGDQEIVVRREDGQTVTIAHDRIVTGKPIPPRPPRRRPR